MTTEWSQQHQAINDLIDHLDEVLPTITIKNSPGNIFVGAAALYRCNRYLRAVDQAVEADAGDTAGGNLRTLYETWVLGHLLLLGSFDEARDIWSGTRHSAEKVLKAIGADVQYPEDAPEAVQDKHVEERARLLGKKLETDDPESATMPTHCYNFIFRSESLLSSHANLTAILQYARPLGEVDGEIGLSDKNKDCQWRTQLAAYITAYYAKQLFKKAGMDTARFNEIEERLDPKIDELSKPDPQVI